MSTSQTNAPLLSPLMRWFLFAMILANIAASMIQMLMPIYLTKLGATVSQVGLVFTLTSIVILTLQVLGGWISDSIGRLKAIAIGSMGGKEGGALELRETEHFYLDLSKLEPEVKDFLARRQTYWRDTVIGESLRKSSPRA